MTATQTTTQDWQKIKAGDKDAFRRLVEPYLAELRKAAEHEITYHVCVGDLGTGSVSPDDLVAEVLLKAWDERQRKPETLDLKAWLFGLLHRTADRLVSEEKGTGDLVRVSLDAPPSDGGAAPGWRQPDDFESWEDVIPDPRTSADEMIAAVEGQPGSLSEPARRILIMHDRHGISIQQVAFVTGTSVARAQEFLLEARHKIQG